MAQYPCPQCTKKMFIEKMHEGYEVPCPHCGDKLRIPHGAAAEPPAAATLPPFSATSADVAVDATAADALGLDATSADSPPALSGEGLAVEPDYAGDDSATVPPRTPAPPVRPPPPPRQHYAPPPRHAGKGQYDTLAFVLGLTGLMICQVLSPFGWYFGHKARAEARRAGREPDGLATAGWVLGIVGTVILGGVAALTFVLIIIGAAGGM